MSGVDSSARAPTSCGSLQEDAGDSPVVVPSRFENSHTTMQPPYRELEEHNH